MEVAVVGSSTTIIWCPTVGVSKFEAWVHNNTCEVCTWSCLGFHSCIVSCNKFGDISKFTIIILSKYFCCYRSTSCVEIRILGVNCCAFVDNVNSSINCITKCVYIIIGIISILCSFKCSLCLRCLDRSNNSFISSSGFRLIVYCVISLVGFPVENISRRTSLCTILTQVNITTDTLECETQVFCIGNVPKSKVLTILSIFRSSSSQSEYNISSWLCIHVCVTSPEATAVTADIVHLHLIMAIYSNQLVESTILGVCNSSIQRRSVDVPIVTNCIKCAEEQSVFGMLKHKLVISKIFNGSKFVYHRCLLNKLLESYRLIRFNRSYIAY